MRADAPYMPIATVGLLAVVSEVDPAVTAAWAVDGAARRLRIETALDTDEVATAIVEAPLPDVSAPHWPTAHPQALGPSLRTTPHPLDAYRLLVATAAPSRGRLLRAIATDRQHRPTARAKPRRSARRQERPVHVQGAQAGADHGAHTRAAQQTAYMPGDSGAALGLVPEVQTFGGTTGREPSDVGAASALLSRLLRHGILALPPSSGSRGGRRVVGGPLVTEQGELSWPRGRVACGLRELRVLFSLASVHDPEPDAHALRERGIDAVFRSQPQPVNRTVAVFRWGRRVI